MNKWVGTGAWEGWRIDGDQLISPTGLVYSPDDVEPNKYTQSDLARILRVTRGAIADRVRRSEKARAEGREKPETLPPYDEPGVWYRDTIKHIFNK